MNFLTDEMKYFCLKKYWYIRRNSTNEAFFTRLLRASVLTNKREPKGGKIFISASISAYFFGKNQGGESRRRKLRITVGPVVTAMNLGTNYGVSKGKSGFIGKHGRRTADTGQRTADAGQRAPDAGQRTLDMLGRTDPF